MARSLLSFRLVYVALLASVSSMSACIIPVAPNFQDPPSVPDPGPYLAGYDPVDGRIVTFTPLVTTFRVLVADQNINAKLFVRWVWDYPPVTSTTKILQQTQAAISAGPDGQPINQIVSYDVTCEGVDNANGLHQLEFLISDRPFQDTSTFGLSDTNKFDSIIDPNGTGHIQRGNWGIVMSCMATTASTTSSP